MHILDGSAYSVQQIVYCGWSVVVATPYINHKSAKSINGTVGHHSPPYKLVMPINYSSHVCAYMKEGGGI